MMVEQDEKEKYMIIDGHRITLSFAKEPNPDLFDWIKSILLSSGTLPQNCRKNDGNGKMQEKAKGT